MEDVLFKEGSLTEAGESTRSHQQDILLMRKGWNKFYPHLGVGIMDYIGDDSNGGLKGDISFEFENDGMRINNITINHSKIIIDAEY